MAVRPLPSGCVYSGHDWILSSAKELPGWWRRLMIFALAMLRVISSLPAFGFIVLLCGLSSWISFRELIAPKF